MKKIHQKIVNNLRAILHSREYTYSDESETRFGLVRVMKISLRFINTVEIGLAVGVSLQLLLFGACEVVAQTKDAVNSEALNSPLNSAIWISPAKVSQARHWLDFNKEFDPDNNGKPRDTRGTGTRCIHDSLENILQNFLI